MIMGYGWLNVGSLLLGLIAWALPIVNIAGINRVKNSNRAAYSAASLGACALALFFQIVYQNYLVRIEDWSAIMDTSGPLVRVSAGLLVIALVLNVAALVVYRVRGR